MENDGFNDSLLDDFVEILRKQIQRDDYFSTGVVQTGNQFVSLNTHTEVCHDSTQLERGKEGNNIGRGVHQNQSDPVTLPHSRLLKDKGKPVYFVIKLLISCVSIVEGHRHIIRMRGNRVRQETVDWNLRILDSLRNMLRVLLCPDCTHYLFHLK